MLVPLCVPHWIKCQLCDFIFLQNGYAFDSKSYRQQGVPVVRISNLTVDYQVVLDDAVCVEDKPDYQNFVIEQGDLLIAMSGATTGKLGVYNHIQIQKIFQNQRVGNLKIIDPNICDSKFRNYLFFSLSNTIVKLAYGGAQPNISSAKLLSLSCSLPPLAEQKRIVKKIEELFAVIDKTVKSLTETKEQLVQYRESVLQQAFSGKLLDGQMSHKQVKDVGEIVTGSTPSTNHSEYYGKDYPFYKPTDLNAGYTTYKAARYVSAQGFKISRQLPANSILVTCIGATIGKTGLIRQTGICNQQINAIIPSKKYMPEFVYFMLYLHNSRIVSK